MYATANSVSSDCLKLFQLCLNRGMGTSFCGLLLETCVITKRASNAEFLAEQFSQYLDTILPGWQKEITERVVYGVSNYSLISNSSIYALATLILINMGASFYIIYKHWDDYTNLVAVLKRFFLRT